MRCPKCQYLGFEPSPRCKNCGYDFSLDRSRDEDLPGLTIVAEPEYEGPLADFDLQILDDVKGKPGEAARRLEFDLGEMMAQEPGVVGGSSASAVATPPPGPKPVARVVKVAPPVATTELPLFMQVRPEGAQAGEKKAPAFSALAPVPATLPMPITIEAATAAMEMPAEADGPPRHVEDDRPLVHVPAVPRAPLAVRRTTPDPARLRAKYSRASKDSNPDLLRGLDDVEAKTGRSRATADRLSIEPAPESLPAEWLQRVSAGKRLAAAAVDALLLGGINAVTVWFTLNVCGLTTAQADLLPAIPILLFFLLLDGTYMVLFIAVCGQTIGKMAAGIRVIGTTTGDVHNDRVTFGQSLARAIGAIASCVPLGVGFWMSLTGDGRALHDRIAHTRVVRA